MLRIFADKFHKWNWNCWRLVSAVQNKLFLSGENNFICRALWTLKLCRTFTFTNSYITHCMKCYIQKRITGPFKQLSRYFLLDVWSQSGLSPQVHLGSSYLKITIFLLHGKNTTEAFCKFYYILFIITFFSFLRYSCMVSYKNIYFP